MRIYSSLNNQLKIEREAIICSTKSMALLILLKFAKFLGINLQEEWV